MGPEILGTMGPRPGTRTGLHGTRLGRQANRREAILPSLPTWQFKKCSATIQRCIYKSCLECIYKSCLEWATVLIRFRADGGLLCFMVCNGIGPIILTVRMIWQAVAMIVLKRVIILDS